MKTQTACFMVGVSLFVLSFDATAQLSNQGMLDQVVTEFATRAGAWQAAVMNAAMWLFWTLGTISLVWTGGMLILKNADIGEFFAEFIRFIMFFGFFLWLLRNGPSFASSIVQSLQRLGEQASNTSAITPSGIVDIGFMIWKQAVTNLSLWSPIDSFVGAALSAGIMLLLAAIAVNMLLVIVSAWILMYAGIFFLGFGGSRWTSDMAINYYRTVLGIAIQLMAMILLISIGNDLLSSFYNKMTKNALNFEELGVMMVFCLALLMLINKIPGLLAGVITGSSINGAGIGNFGAGAVVGATMGAAGMASAAASMGGSMIASGAANAAGGAQALMAACSKAGENVDNGADIISEIFGDKSAAYRGGYSSLQGENSGSGNGGSFYQDPFKDKYAESSAIGAEVSEKSSGGNQDASTSSIDNGSDKSSSSAEKSQGLASGSDTESGSETSLGSASGSETTSGSGSTASSGSTEPNNATLNTSGDAGSNSKSGSNFSFEPTDFSNDSFGPPGAATGNAEASDTKAQPATSAKKPNPMVSGIKSTAIAAGKLAATAGKLTADTGANLVKGTASVAKAKASEMKGSASQRISETTGGKIAAAIKGLNNGSTSTTEDASKPGMTAPTFTGNNIGGAATAPQDSSKSHFPPPSEYKNRSNEKDFDPAAEIAAFVNRKNPDSV